MIGSTLSAIILANPSKKCAQNARTLWHNRDMNKQIDEKYHKLLRRSQSEMSVVKFQIAKNEQKEVKPLWNMTQSWTSLERKDAFYLLVNKHGN